MMTPERAFDRRYTFLSIPLIPAFIMERYRLPSTDNGLILIIANFPFDLQIYAYCIMDLV
jgi:hypothetical protein